MGVAAGGQDAVVAKKLLDLQQIDTGLDQVRGIAVAQTVGRDLFLARPGRHLAQHTLHATTVQRAGGRRRATPTCRAVGE